MTTPKKELPPTQETRTITVPDWPEARILHDPRVGELHLKPGAKLTLPKSLARELVRDLDCKEAP